jgi:flagellar L-ring protein precursor FlgH
MNWLDKSALAVLLVAVFTGCAQTQIVVQPDPQFAPIDMKAFKFQPESNGSIFQAGRSVRLFEDNKAYRIGDVLSIVLSESTNASNSAETTTTKDDDTENSVSALLGVVPTLNGNEILNNDLESKRKFTGKGESEQSNSLSGEIAVMVVDILPNGNLVVRGEKLIGLNQGSEFIRISGLVRPLDVSTNNTIMSRKLANARIYYGGGGVIAEANTRGWLSRLFSSPGFPL